MKITAEKLDQIFDAMNEASSGLTVYSPLKQVTAIMNLCSAFSSLLEPQHAEIIHHEIAYHIEYELRAGIKAAHDAKRELDEFIKAANAILDSTS